MKAATIPPAKAAPTRISGCSSTGRLASGPGRPLLAAVLLLLGALAGYIAARAMKSGAPPTPAMAIDEAKRIKETVQSPHPERTI